MAKFFLNYSGFFPSYEIWIGIYSFGASLFDLQRFGLRFCKKIKKTKQNGCNMSTLTSLRSFTVTLRCQNLSTFHFKTNLWMKHYFLSHWCSNICIKKKVSTVHTIFNHIDPIWIVHIFSLYSVQNRYNWYENIGCFPKFANDKCPF